jgi:putative PEP-CTERM system histidine kinase
MVFFLMETGSFLVRADALGLSDILFGKIVLAGELMLPGTWLLFSANILRVESPASNRRWRIAILASFLLSAATYGLMVGVFPGASLATLLRIKAWNSIFLIIMFTVILAIFERAIRLSEQNQRKRIKFLLVGIGSILVLRIYVHSQYLIFPTQYLDFIAFTSAGIIVGCLLVAYSLARHQLMDVDVFISRYFIYNSFTILAVGVYLLAVGLAAQAIRSFGGDASRLFQFLFVFITVVLMLMVLLSTGVQKKVKMFIDRNFYRNRYDYHKEWLTLTENVSSKLDVKELLAPIVRMFFDTLWINRTILWIYDERKNEFHLISPDKGFQGVQIPADMELVGLLRNRDYPIDLDKQHEDPEVEAVEKDQKTLFLSREIPILVPLITGGRLVGIFGLSRSDSGRLMDKEDYDLMKTVAKQAAGSFLNAKLSQDLVRAKELEAFHSFSAFVLHDLKNFVSMLSLVAQNSERNLENPEFRKDTMRSITQTVEKMKVMMNRLSILSKEVHLDCTPTNIGELARETLNEIKPSLKSRVVEDLAELPAVNIDPVQFKKVIVNLLLNAEEAVGRGGEIRLAAGVSDGKIVLAVSDNGCGMSPDYLRNHLFKPFMTTKSHGFGIGLFQVKRIVEAHNGRIDVESDVGKGTTFRVLLPQAQR